MISEFLSGLAAVLALVAVGCALALILGGMVKRFPFSRLALVLALTPISFASFLEHEGNTTLQLFAMVVILLGITIDGIAYLIEPKARHVAADAEEEIEEESDLNQPSGVIVWEKAK